MGGGGGLTFGEKTQQEPRREKCTWVARHNQKEALEGGGWAGGQPESRACTEKSADWGLPDEGESPPLPYILITQHQRPLEIPL